MINKLKNYNSSQRLFDKDDIVLIAVSAGIDSMLMLHLLQKSIKHIAVAHCNFKLRGEESDGDEQFVKDYCKEHAIKIFTKVFNTTKYAEEKGISIQMAARDLRYAWLDELRNQYSFSLIAIGHNQNDSIETFLINLSRGSGLNGLCGIRAKSDFIIRPLLFASREEISEYALKNNIEFREDSSNAETKYTRNKIRHELIPLLCEINPSVVNSLQETIMRLEMARQIYSGAINDAKSKLLRKTSSDDTSEIKVDELKKLKPLRTFIYEIFKDYGFGRLHVDDLLNLLEAQTGKYLVSSSHSVSRDRDRIIIATLSRQKYPDLIINNEKELIKIPEIESVNTLDINEFKLITDPAYACLDADSISYPLRVRYWKEGDFMFPLGMKGRKKISDLLIDNKIPLNQKKHVRILESESNICWVIGIKIDDRYKLNHDSHRVIILKSK